MISPEGCAAILWKHRKHAPEAAAALKLTARDLLELQLIDGIVPEPLGGAHQDPEQAAALVDQALQQALVEVRSLPADARLERRYAKFRHIGALGEGIAQVAGRHVSVAPTS